MRLVELSRSEHAEVRIREDLVEVYAASQHLIQIVVSEFRKAATQYPIVFAKHPDTGRFAPYVLNGLGVGENLFWSGTELDVTYVPLNVRRQPFYVGIDDGPEARPKGGPIDGPSARSSDGPDRPASHVLCIDLDSPCVQGQPGGRRIVEPDGRDSSYLKQILSILGELVAGRPKTEHFIATLLSLDLLAPLLLDIALEDGTPLKLEGLYGLDEDSFRQLGESTLANLWKTGHLDLIYSVLVSGGQIFRLLRLKNQRNASSRAWHSNTD